MYASTLRPILSIEDTITKWYEYTENKLLTLRVKKSGRRSRYDKPRSAGRRGAVGGAGRDAL